MRISGPTASRKGTRTAGPERLGKRMGRLTVYPRPVPPGTKTLWSDFRACRQLPHIGLVTDFDRGIGQRISCLRRSPGPLHGKDSGVCIAVPRPRPVQLGGVGRTLPRGFQSQLTGASGQGFPRAFCGGFSLGPAASEVTLVAMVLARRTGRASPLGEAGDCNGAGIAGSAHGKTRLKISLHPAILAVKRPNDGMLCL